MSNYIITLKAAETISTAEATHAALRHALETSPKVVIDCEDVKDSDLCLVQLLMAARRSADQTGKSLKLKAASNPPVVDTLVRAGCGRVKDNEILWSDSFWNGDK